MELSETDWIVAPASSLSEEARKAALIRQSSLTKPPGSLGRLERCAVELAALQDTAVPVAKPVYIGVFAADHGVAIEGVSAFPAEVTGEMVRNFARGGAAISVMAEHLDAQLEVISLGLVNDPGELENVVRVDLGPGTANLLNQPAMTDLQLVSSLDAGRQIAEKVVQTQCQLFVGGEMGIANTTSASALACAFLGLPPEELAGPGTGLDKEGVERKSNVIETALKYHGPALREGQPLTVLKHLGGFEIAGLVGAYVGCAQRGTPVLVDGFIASVAALTAVRINPSIEPWLLYSHCSAEPGHKHVLAALDANPLLDLDMRLGEGSGAAIAVLVLEAACQLHNNMATFAEAGVNEGTD
ncbi:MAG TPA: nicotinate-nucleotide--dimethylbenzimidazole phosphoribosyltransferase [Gammaproteobacteria bacterium]|nr:nicotinate-nucleotide--dimethylbenzimidazole phosphoribosyltransferase [Gammaproteobacteria bacterium]